MPLAVNLHGSYQNTQIFIGNIILGLHLLHYHYAELAMCTYIIDEHTGLW